MTTRDRTMIRPFAALIAAAILGALALSAKTGDDGEDAEDASRLALPVATIDGEAMTLGYLESAIERQSPLLRKELDDPTKREEFLQKLINMELLAAEAERRGYADDDEVESVLRNQLASLMHRRLADEIAEQEPTEEDLRAYYEEHIDSYRKPEKMRARHILISDRAKAEQLLADIEKKEPSQYEFRRLAQENSEDEATRLRGGDLTFFPRPSERREDDPEVPDAVAEAAFALEENGDISQELVKTDAGFHVVMRTGHRDKMDLSFEEARDRLVMLVKREQRKEAVEAAIDALKERFPVKLHEEHLKDVVIDLSGGPPEPNAPGGRTKKEKAKAERAREAQKKAYEKALKRRQQD